MSKVRTKLFDVVAVNMATYKVRLLSEDKSEESAEAIIKMAIMRRGVDTEFYAAVQAGSYSDGDEYKSDGQ